ncbi:MAG: PP2C family protein-serine/threonine phosphatase [[Clostridium] scindens]
MFHETNEDAYLRVKMAYMNDKAMDLIAVADGVTHLAQGEKAAWTAVDAYLRTIQERLQGIYKEKKECFSLYCHADTVEKAMQEALQEANRAVCKIGEGLEAGGTTLSAITLMEDMAIVINTGDSPVYHYRAGEGDLYLESHIMNKAEADASRGKYEKETEDYYQNTHILLSYLGKREDLSEREISLRYIYRIAPGDKLILGTDGAFGETKKEQICQMAREENGQGLIMRLFETARDTDDDDQTAILLEF